MADVAQFMTPKDNSEVASSQLPAIRHLPPLRGGVTIKPSQMAIKTEKGPQIQSHKECISI